MPSPAPTRRGIADAHVLTYHLAGRLVLAQALIDGGAQAACLRPVRELDLGHEPWLAVDRLARRALTRGKGRRRTLQRDEQRRQAAKAGLVEAAAHTPDVAKRPVVVHAQQQRTDGAAALALARNPAAHNELLAAHALDLHPAARAHARLIDGVQPLGDDSLETLGGAGLQQRVAVADHVLRRL